VISLKALDIFYVLMLMRSGGGVNLSFFPLAQLYMLQHGYRMVLDFYHEIKKFSMFRTQLRDIDINFPLVEYRPE